MQSNKTGLRRRLGLLPVAALPLLLGVTSNASPTGKGGNPCTQAANEALLSCRKEAAGDFWLQRAKCTNLPSFAQRLSCTLEAFAEYKQEIELCWERRGARFELCDALGQGYYTPKIDPDDFVPVVDHPFFPLLPGTTRVYEKQAGGETERIEVTVLNETKEVLGVECTVVRDVVSVDGEVVEDTLDWFAQDKSGNVWYFGEISRDYEDGELVSLGGSWKAGEDGAHPGIVMLADPRVGDVYRQEFLIREAEDVAAVLSLSEAVSVPFGSFTGCLQTEDYTPIDPDVLEHKYYAFGIGAVLEVDVETGERTELIEVLVD